MRCLALLRLTYTISGKEFFPALYIEWDVSARHLLSKLDRGDSSGIITGTNDERGAK